jgi:hypothetical protein
MSTNEDKGLDLTPLKDDDPDGVKLLTSPEPLERAWKLLTPLLRLSLRDIDSWTSIYDVAVRRGAFNGKYDCLVLNLLYLRQVRTGHKSAQSCKSYRCRSS